MKLERRQPKIHSWEKEKREVKNRPPLPLWLL